MVGGKIIVIHLDDMISILINMALGLADMCQTRQIGFAITTSDIVFDSEASRLSVSRINERFAGGANPAIEYHPTNSFTSVIPIVRDAHEQKDVLIVFICDLELDGGLPGCVILRAVHKVYNKMHIVIHSSNKDRSLEVYQKLKAEDREEVDNSGELRIISKSCRQDVFGFIAYHLDIITNA